MLETLVESTITAAEIQQGKEICVELRNALNALSRIPLNQRQPLTNRLAESLGQIQSPTGAGFLAIWLGICVETGELNPESTTSPILEKFLALGRTIITSSEEDVDDPTPDEETLAGLKLLGQSLVAHLVRCSKLRAEISFRSDVIVDLERIGHLSFGVMWVLTLLRQRSGELLVFHVQLKRGLRVAYENISNCFHLFTLLQHALAKTLPGEGEVSNDVIAIAQGKAAGEGQDSAWWHYGQGNVPEANVMATVFGELSPDAIVRIKGEQVLLLWPSILQGRMWDAGFFQPVLEASPPNVILKEELSLREVDQWWKELRLPVPQKKPWWKFR